MTTRSCKVATADPFNFIVCMFQVLLNSHIPGEANQKACKVGVYGGKLQVRGLCLPAVQHDEYCACCVSESVAVSRTLSSCMEEPCIVLM
jgi:hypothetical protein